MTNEAQGGPEFDFAAVGAGVALGCLGVLAIVASVTNRGATGAFGTPGLLGTTSGNVPIGLIKSGGTGGGAGDARQLGEYVLPKMEAGASGQTTAPLFMFGDLVTIVRDLRLGDTLADLAGRPFYVFDGDTPASSSCDIECMTIWIPYVFPEASLPSSSIVKLGVVTRQLAVGPGSPGVSIEQLTINGRPVWTYLGDVPRQGEVTHHGADGKWWALGRNGNPLPR